MELSRTHLCQVSRTRQGLTLTFRCRATNWTRYSTTRSISQSFQMGGAEFDGTERQYQNLIASAKAQNSRLSAVSF